MQAAQEACGLTTLMHTCTYRNLSSLRACVCTGLFHGAAWVSWDVGQPSLPSLHSAWTPPALKSCPTLMPGCLFPCSSLVSPPQDTQAPHLQEPLCMILLFGRLLTCQQHSLFPRSAYGGSSSDSTFLRNILEVFEQGWGHSGRILKRWCIGASRKRRHAPGRRWF